MDNLRHKFVLGETRNTRVFVLIVLAWGYERRARFAASQLLGVFLNTIMEKRGPFIHALLQTRFESEPFKLL